MKNKFLFCGIIGWCAEILWTGLHSLADGKLKLMGKSSLWMFPIYGCAVIIDPLSKRYGNLNVFVRGIIYMIHIFFGEFVFGTILKKFDACPWDYSSSPYHINGVIRLDFAPLWFGLGLFFEYFFKKNRAKKPQP